MKWGKLCIWLLSNFSRLMTPGQDLDNYSLFCNIHLAHHLRLCFVIRCESLVCSVDVNVTAIVCELVHETRGRMWHPISLMLIENNTSGGWQEFKFCGWESAIHDWIEFATHIIENMIFLEGQSDVYYFLHCFMGWVTLWLFPTMEVNKVYWVTNANGCSTHS